MNKCLYPTLMGRSSAVIQSRMFAPALQAKIAAHASTGMSAAAGAKTSLSVARLRAARRAMTRPSISRSPGTRGRPMIQSMNEMDMLTEKLSKLDIRHINDKGFKDNCYICVAAFLAGLEDHTALEGKIQYKHQGEVGLNKVSEILKAVNLNGDFKKTDVEAVRKYLSSGPKSKGALAYVRKDGTGHVIAITNGGQYPLYDPQQSGRYMSVEDWLKENPTACWVAML